MVPSFHICHVITGLGRGGAESMLVKLLESARRASPHSHEVISLGDDGVHGAHIRTLGIPLKTLNLRGTTALVRGVPALRRHFAALPAATVVQSWMYHADLLCALALLGRSAPPLLWNIRASVVSRADLGTATAAVVRACGLLARHAPQRILGNSVAAIEGHAAWGYPRERFLIVPNGFDTSLFHPDAVARDRMRKTWRASSDQLLIGLVARIDPMKDHATFIAAAAQLRAPMPVRFVLVGRDADSDAHLTGLIDSHGLANRFIRLPDQGDMPAVMNALDIVCLSSRSEGFPNVLGEAMACGTPVVSTAAGEAASIVDDPDRIVRSGDAAALARALERVAGLPAHERRLVGQRDRARVQREYDIAAVWRRYENIYWGALQELSPQPSPGAAPR